jgi:hypothetical protein
MPATSLHLVRPPFSIPSPLPAPPLKPTELNTLLAPRQPESSIAPYLTALQTRTKADGIRIGSYPLLQHGVYVSFIGQDRAAVQALAEATARDLEGRLVSDEEAREMVRAKERGAA